MPLRGDVTGEVARNKVKVTQKVLDGIMEVRDSGQTNMMDRGQVMVVADSLGFHDVVCWIEDNPKDYARGILRGFRT